MDTKKIVSRGDYLSLQCPDAESTRCRGRMVIHLIGSDYGRSQSSIILKWFLGLEEWWNPEDIFLIQEKYEEKMVWYLKGTIEYGLIYVRDQRISLHIYNVTPRFWPCFALNIYDENIVWNHGKELKAKALPLIDVLCIGDQGWFLWFMVLIQALYIYIYLWISCKMQTNKNTTTSYASQR